MEDPYNKKIFEKYAKLVKFGASLQAPFLNWGYWETETDKVPDTRAEASLNLLMQVVRKAKIRKEHYVLDVGCGLGATSFETFRISECQKIIGIDMCCPEIEYARKTFEDYRDNVEFKCMNATQLEFDSETFDRVMGIECAFHFKTRELFLKQTKRVLKTDGKLILTDWIKGDTGEGKFASFFANLVLTYWNIPPKNIVNKKQYKIILEQNGFKNIEVYSIAQHVIPPYIKYIQSKKGNRELRGSMGKFDTMLYSIMLTVVNRLYKKNMIDYVLVYAEK